MTVHMKIGERQLYTGGEWVELRSSMPLAMAWTGWISFCILQWFGLRLDQKVVVETDPNGVPDTSESGCVHIPVVARVRFDRLRFAWPLTGWCWNPGGYYNTYDIGNLGLRDRPDDGVWNYLRRGPLRVAMLVPMLLSLPTLFAIGVLVWWLV